MRCAQMVAFLLSIFLSPVSSASSMPDALYQGMIDFELESESYFNALVLMDEEYQAANPIDYAYGLKGFHIDSDITSIVENAKRNKSNDLDWYSIGKIEYENGNCKPALRAFKQLKNKLTLNEKQKWAFYRANCFIKLGSKKRAAQVLNDILSGVWTSYAYFNLAMAYAESSHNKSRALITLRIAESFLKDKTREEKSLKDRINLAAGSLYLNEDKPDLAIAPFKKVFLDSDSSADALYLIGVAYHELGDFRAATQSWFSVKKYSLLRKGVAEAYLALPYAYEGAKYTSQALEAYLEASSVFKKELATIEKIDKLITQYGVKKTLIDEVEIAGLQWFLTKDVATNTTRASYYKYFAQDTTIYDLFELNAELSMILDSLNFWDTQLTVYDQSLQGKRKTFKKKISEFDKSNKSKLIQQYDSTISTLASHKNMTPTLSQRVDIDSMISSIETLRVRLSDLKENMRKGGGKLQQQIQQIKSLKSEIKSAKTSLDHLTEKLDKQMTILLKYRLSELKTEMVTNYERAQQGLVHILETIAESKQIQKRSLLDGRYK